MSQNHRDNTLSILCITTLFPNKINERHGIFIYNRLKKLKELHDVKIHVISPVPLRSLAAFKKDVSSEKDAIFDSVSRPRFISIPIVNQFLSYFFIALAAFFPARRIIKKHNISVIDSHFLYPDAVSANIISKLFKLPLTVTARGSDVNYWLSRKVPGFFIKWTIKNAKYNFAVSQKLAEKMMAAAPKANIKVLPNGVDNEIFTYDPKNNRNAETYLILSVGNLIPLKGHDKVIEAISDIKNVKLEIIGHGPEKPFLIEKVNSLNISNKVSFIDNLPQETLSYKYQSAHALVLASEMEGMPNVVLEAMSCGLQVICTPVGDLPDIITEKYGWIVNRDVLSIKLAITNSIETPKDPITIHNYSKENFSWDTTINNYYQFLKNE